MDDFLREIALEHRSDLLSSANDGFEMSLEIAGTDALINNVAKRVILENRGKIAGVEKVIAAKIGDISNGDIVFHDDQSWLITDTPSKNDIYLKAPLKLCNSTYPISNKTRVLKLDAQGNPIIDKFGDPVPIITETVTHVPCIVSNLFPAIDENRGQLLLPQGQLRITLQYQDVDDFKVNHKFLMYQNTYQIRSVDYTKVINGKGVVTLNVEEVSNKAVT